MHLNESKYLTVVYLCLNSFAIYVQFDLFKQNSETLNNPFQQETSEAAVGIEITAGETFVL